MEKEKGLSENREMKEKEEERHGEMKGREMTEIERSQGRTIETIGKRKRGGGMKKRKEETEE